MPLLCVFFDKFCVLRGKSVTLHRFFQHIDAETTSRVMAN